jgi:Zn-dependent protease with chaperone function
MTDAQFESLVTRLDAQAQRDPAGYRRRVILLALAGYGYLAGAIAIALVPLLLSLLAIGTLKALGVKLILIFGAFIWLVLRALCVRVDRPQGRRVGPHETPELFALIEQVRRPLGAVRVHEVLITDEFNAAVAQTPRLGPLGWHHNTLLIGLPLMKALSHEQLAAVLAHEFGHLAGGHGRLGNWIYRLRAGWSRLADALHEQQSGGRFLFKPFFDRFVPYFSAYSFPLARANEYEADAASARLTSPVAAAAALTGVNVIGSFLEARYWPDLHRRADDVPQPSFAPYAAMGQAIGADVDEASLRGWLDDAMARQTSLANTHPSLADRLRALGESPRLMLPAAGQTADALLGSALPAITAEFDERWQRSIQPSWERRHREVADSRALLAQLDARAADEAAAEPLTVDERLQRARLTDEFGAGSAEALAQLAALHRDAPDHAGVSYSLGLRMLRQGDDAGVALIEAAIERDDEALLPGAELLRDYHAQNGRDELAHQWHERWLQRALAQQAAAAERANIRLNDRFAAHGLDAGQIDGLRAQLRRIDGLRKAWLVRKLLADESQPPLFVLGFSVTPWWRPHRKALAERVQDEIARHVEFPVPATVVGVDGDNYRFGRKWRFMRGTRVL